MKVLYVVIFPYLHVGIFTLTNSVHVNILKSFFLQKTALPKLLPQYLEIHIIVEKDLVSQTFPSPHLIPSFSLFLFLSLNLMKIFYLNFEDICNF